MKIDGSCHCGNITYEAEIDPDTVAICHCTDCQTLSGSPYRALVPVAAERLVLQGSPKIYIKTADSGSKRAQAFCAECGTPIYASAAEHPTSFSLRLGAIEQRAQLRPMRQIWCGSALPWAMALDGIPKLTGQR